jgi:hypothetical protein
MSVARRADSCRYALIANFMNERKVISCDAIPT